MAYDAIAFSIAAYEASPEVNAFTAKFDYARKGQAKLTKEEQKGFALFQGKGKCSRCHVSNGQQPLFTDYTYDNLGIPKNPLNPVYRIKPDFVDLGLGGFLASRTDYAQFAVENQGKHKVPTLRNVAKGSCEAETTNLDCIVKAYGHNGYFMSLADIVHFYNTRDVPGAGWPAPEVLADEHSRTRQSWVDACRRGGHRRLPEDTLRWVCAEHSTGRQRGGGSGCAEQQNLPAGCYHQYQVDKLRTARQTSLLDSKYQASQR